MQLINILNKSIVMNNLVVKKCLIRRQIAQNALWHLTPFSSQCVCDAEVTFSGTEAKSEQQHS